MTVKLWISSTVRRNCDADELLREFAEKKGITGRDFNHLCLLTEETLGMAGQLLHVYEGELRLEETAAGYEIILEADVHEKDGGKAAPAASPQGFMAKIAEMMNCSFMFENIMEMPEELAGKALFLYPRMGFLGNGARAWAGRWSLSAYRQNLRDDPGAEPALEELEKSIVAHLADEVTIGIHGQKIRLVIAKEI